MLNIKPYSHRYAYVYCNGELEGRYFLSVHNHNLGRMAKIIHLHKRVAKAAKQNPENNYWIELKYS